MIASLVFWAFIFALSAYITGVLMGRKPKHRNVIVLCMAVFVGAMLAAYYAEYDNHVLISMSVVSIYFGARSNIFLRDEG